MGMGCSQVHLLALTARKHDIGLELEHLSNDKQALTREMQRISREYNQSLSSKTLKWSNNSGVTYVDLSYSTLMRPSSVNQNKPYLLTNNNGKIVLDSKYSKYASLISPTGAPNGDYESNRTEILCELTGISPSKFNDFGSKSTATDATVDAYNKAKDETTKARKAAFETLDSTSFVKKWGNAGGVDFTNANVGKMGMVSVGDGAGNAQTTVRNIANGLVNNLSPYLEDGEIEALKTAANAVAENYCGQISAVEGGSNSQIVNKDGDTFKINMDDFVAQVMGGYASKSSSAQKNSQGDYSFECISGNGREDDNYKAYLAAKSAEEAAKANYNGALDNENSVFNAEEESLIKFYDLLFNAIAEKGWETDSQIDDADYLNNMLQNNTYTITTMTENESYDASETKDSSKMYKYKYDTDIASNFNKIFYVNDEDIRQEALANYEYEKSVINSKETRIDTRMKNLETEQSAINQMIKGIEQVRNDNIERNFSIFS